MVEKIDLSGMAEEIRREVRSWPGVEAKPHRSGGVEFRVRGHEIGHLHGNHWADLPFPVHVRKELVVQGKARLHYVLPQTGWVSYPIRGRGDVIGALELFKMNYERLAAREKGKARA